MTFANKWILVCLSILTALLPIQNFLITLLIVRLGLPSWLSFWKECLVMIVMGLMLISVIRSIINFLKLKKQSSIKLNLREIFVANCKVCLVSISIVPLNLIILINSLLLNQITLYQFVVGYRFELFWLVFLAVSFIWFRICVSKELATNLLHNLTKFLMVGFAIVLILASWTLLHYSFNGNNDFLEWFGYSPSSLVLDSNLAVSPVCHVVDFGIDKCRLAVPFGSANHLAAYLILMLSFFGFQLSNCWQSFGNSWKNQLVYNAQNPMTRSVLVIVCILIFLIIQTYSRFALIGLILVLFSIVLLQLQKKYLFFNRYYSWIQSLFVFLVLGVSILITSFDPQLYIGFLPDSIAKPSSSLEHYRLAQVNLDIIKSDPKILVSGLGLGSSGPASNYTKQSTLQQKYEYLSYKWFVKENRIKIPENWYIQILLNGGLLYLILYLILVSIPIWQLKKSILAKENAVVFLMGFAAIIIGNLFLHLWENQTIAFYWTVLWIIFEARKKLIEIQN